MKIGIVSCPGLDEAAGLVEEILEFLEGVEVYLAPQTAEFLDREGIPVEEMNLDSLVTLGGDGTVLRNLQKKPETPILGINMGVRGFLADVNPDEATEAIGKMVNGELEVFERERLSVNVSEERLADALNECTIRSVNPGTTISFEIYINGEWVETNKGDGVIVSTPTGSTAYALAAGGPILDPEVEAFLAVPLSTHHSKVMPLVYPMSSEFEVELQEDDEKAYVTVDGQITKEARSGEVISFEKSESSAKFYRWKGKFYEKVGEKL